VTGGSGTRRRGRRALSRAGLAAASTLGLAGCLGSPATTLAPQSSFGDVSHALFLQILWWDTAIFVVVAVVLVAAVIRFRERDPRAAPPRQLHGDLRLEVAWTVAPAIILAFIAFPTIRGIFATRVTAPVPAAAAPAGAVRVEVIGHRWWWEFRYPELGVTTATDLHLPAGRPASLEIHGADVIHSFWVPALGGKRDGIPGHRNRILLTPRTPGRYYGQCAEFCGISHANMRHAAVVLPPAEFDAWVARQQGPAAAPAEGSPAAEGLRLFQQGQCVGCHRVDGVSAGTFGPDLTHLGSRATLAGGMLPNTPEHLARWLRDPPGVKPGALMPKVPLTDQEVAALVAYLGSLR
jgi:cytochrome c oxidase subunit 2